MTYCEQKLELKPLETAFKNKYCQWIFCYESLCLVMCGLCHIQNVLIVVEYPNCRQTLVAIWMGQI